MQKEVAMYQEFFRRVPVMKTAAIAAASVLVVFAAAAAEGQTVVTGGAKGGITFATLPSFAGEAEVDTGYRPGVLAGGFLAVEFAGAYAFQPEFLYAMKGVHIHPTGETVKGSVDLSYLEIPLLFRFSPRTKGRVGFDLFAGPAVAFRLGADATVGDGEDSETQSLKDEIKGTDVGLVVGGGVHIGKVSIEARWTEGLVNIVSDPLDGAQDMKNRTFSVLVGYKFR
jgi:hypothetical protein